MDSYDPTRSSYGFTTKHQEQPECRDDSIKINED